MKGPMPPLLIVDDEKNMRLSLETVMHDEGYEVQVASSGEEALELMGRQQFFLVICDGRLGSGMSGYDFLKQSKKKHPSTPTMIITAYATPKLAVEAIKSGAEDYLAKPFAPEELLHAAARCAEKYRLRQDNEALRRKAEGVYSLDQILGQSAGIVDMRRLIETVAPTDATVLILGESGTGKELIGGALHVLSRRRDKSYVRINCAAIPEALLESELFGHEKGSFTGAMKQKIGRVEEADGGTLFLDEIGDMSRPLQAKLLRFLEDGSFTRIGGNQELKVNVRLVAATNRDIVEAIKDQQFREDLFHRLNVVQLRPPPLRDRGEDALILADYFLRQFTLAMNKRVTGFSAGARKKLLSHAWPGNVRELRNVVERAVILSVEEVINIEDLPDFEVENRLRGEIETNPRFGAPSPSVAQSSFDSGILSGEEQDLNQQLANFETEAIMTALRKHNFNMTSTSESLGITRHALRYRMRKLQLDLDSDSGE